MRQSTHELHNLAAHAQDAAATAHGKGDHLTASSKTTGGMPELHDDLNPPHK
jgi:hypothetical protein